MTGTVIHLPGRTRPTGPHLTATRACWPADWWDALSIRQVCDRVGCSRSTLYAWLGADTFPPPDLRIGSQARWLLGTVILWLDARAASPPPHPSHQE